VGIEGPLASATLDALDALERPVWEAIRGGVDRPVVLRPVLEAVAVLAAMLGGGIDEATPAGLADDEGHALFRGESRRWRHRRGVESAPAGPAGAPASGRPERAGHSPVGGEGSPMGPGVTGDAGSRRAVGTAKGG
jgi:hypothetical protein